MKTDKNLTDRKFWRMWWTLEIIDHHGILLREIDWQIKDFRHKVRKHNQLVNFKIDPEIRKGGS